MNLRCEIICCNSAAVHQPMLGCSASITFGIRSAQSARSTINQQICCKVISSLVRDLSDEPMLLYTTQPVRHSQVKAKSDDLLAGVPVEALGSRMNH